MILRRLFLTCMFALVCALLSDAVLEGHTTSAFAAKSKPSAWRTFSSRSVGVSFRFPSTWKLSGLSALSRTVVVSGSGKSFYALTVLRVGIAPGITSQVTLQRFISYEQSVAHSSIYARTHWISTSLGGQPASAGVLRYPTEGGTHTLSDAVYVAQARGHVFEIVMASYHKPALSRLGQFPSVYGQILRSWRFV